MSNLNWWISDSRALILRKWNTPSSIWAAFISTHNGFHTGSGQSFMEVGEDAIKVEAMWKQQCTQTGMSNLSEYTYIALVPKRNILVDFRRSYHSCRCLTTNAPIQMSCMIHAWLPLVSSISCVKSARAGCQPLWLCNFTVNCTLGLACCCYVVLSISIDWKLFFLRCWEWTLKLKVLCSDVT